jgi:hypothetical protein
MDSSVTVKRPRNWVFAEPATFQCGMPAALTVDSEGARRPQTTRAARSHHVPVLLLGSLVTGATPGRCAPGC